MRVVVTQYEGIDATPVLPLAAGCLVAAARQDAELAAIAYEIVIERQPIPAAVEALGKPAVLGLSLYPWNAAYTLAVAAAARAAHPSCRIVAGGPSVPRRAEKAQEFLRDHPAIDILAFGEGELTFREIVRATLREGPLDHIPGIAGRGLMTASAVRVTDFTTLRSPYLDGTFDALIARHRSRFTMALCETNRGCPFSCTFCDWSLTTKVVEFPLERVHAELEWVVSQGFSHVMLADANFGIRPRDTAIARWLVEAKRKTGRPASFYFYLTKNNHGRNLETIEILQEAGIGTWVGLAVQDFDDGVLEAVKRDKIQTGEAMKLRAICGERGIPTFNELILGLPGQTYDSFRRTVATAMPALPRHDFVLFLCRLIDNTEMGSPESRHKYGIETRLCLWKTSMPGWQSIIDEYQEVVVATKDMPLNDWRRTYRLVFLASALYNLRLLRVVCAVVPIPLGDYLERLADHMDGARPGSVYAAMGGIFQRYLDSLLNNGPFVLPYGEEPEAPPIPIEEAIAMQALSRYGEFLAETEALTPEATAEAFRYQRFIVPEWKQPHPREDVFDHDWPEAMARATAPVQRPTRVRFTPGSAVQSAAERGYIENHLALVRARLDSGRIDRVDEPLAAPPARSQTPAFVVLPASG